MATSRSSAVSAASTLQPSGQDSAQLPLLSETSTASESSQGIGRESRSSMMSVRLFQTPRAIYGEHPGMTLETHLTGQAQSDLSPVGSLANLTALQESVRRLVMNVTSGTSAPGSQASFDLAGPCLKTCRDFYRQKAGHSSPVSSVIWPRWGIAWDGGYGALTTLGQFTNATECSSSREVPTPSVCGNYNRKGASKTSGDGLATFVKMWPTPTTRDHKDGPASSCKNVEANGLLGREVHGSPDPTGASGALNPRWVEWLMGFPDGWTDLGHSEMPSSRSKPTRSSRQSRTSKG